MAKAINLKLSDDGHRRLKVLAAEAGLTFQRTIELGLLALEGQRATPVVDAVFTEPVEEPAPTPDAPEPVAQPESSPESQPAPAVGDDDWWRDL